MTYTKLFQIRIELRSTTIPKFTILHQLYPCKMGSWIVHFLCLSCFCSTFSTSISLMRYIHISDHMVWLKCWVSCSFFTDWSGHKELIPRESCHHRRHRPGLCHPWPVQRHCTWGLPHMVLLHSSHDLWRSRTFQMEPFWLN